MVEDSNKTVEHSENKENEDNATLKIHRKYEERKMSDLSVKVIMQKNRNQGLGNIRAIIENSLKEKKIDEADIQNLLMNRKFSLAFFGLFDVRGQGCLVQSTWFGQLRYWAKDKSHGKPILTPNKRYFVEHIEAITYLIAAENSVLSDDFFEIMNCKGVANKIVQVLKEDTHGQKINVDDLMRFILTATLEYQINSESTEESTERLKKLFQENLGKDKQEINLEEFKKIIPSKGKDEFFISQIFNIFDQDGSGHISLTEFVETIKQYSKKDDDSKIKFLFRIYDFDGDGVITEKEFQEVLTACMKENGLDFDENELSNLAHLLFLDGVEEGSDTMTLDGFYQLLHRQEGLVEGLGIMINKWLVPPRPPKEKSILQKLYSILPQRYVSKDYWLNNKSLLSFILLILIVNLALFTQRGYYFRNFSMLNGFTPNIFYLVSRACGRTLLFNSVLVLLLVLRNSITLLRKFGLAAYLPLDNNIYLHKLVGFLIFLQSCLHTIMHLCNFAINVQPNPVKFLQLTYKYWEDYYGVGVPLTLYKLPPGCTLVNSSELCLPGSLDVPSGVNPDFVYNNGIFVCQACDENGSPWTYAEWILTMKPHMFGLMHGMAGPTGMALICILTIMFICSMPFVRRRGHFEIFYFTHLLYHAYFVLLLFHAPEFWKWFVVVGLIWVIERIYRILHRFFGHGKTVIKAGIILPSKVINLIIERPPGFSFNAGDWVRVRIPALASSEWHPFTISSAPEMKGHITLHIRGVGEWTNSLYKLFENEYARQKAGEGRKVSVLDRIQGSVRQRAISFKPNKTNSLKENSFAAAFVKRSEERKDEKLDNTGQGNRQLQKPSFSRSFSKTVEYDTGEFEGVEIIENNKNEIEKTGQKTHLETPLEIFIDGPFGSPSSNIYHAEHAVLIGTGIGITPFASILQSIMYRYWAIKQCCPNCNHRWTSDMEDSMFKLKKVDFFWVNRDQKSFEWFVYLLSQLEIEQEEHGGAMSRFLDMHMYVTSALQRTDMKAVALQLALDILHKKEDRDLVTGLKARTNAGRPNWDKVFTKLRQERKGQVTVFYCGNPMLATTLRYKCEEFGFNFRKEVF